MCFRFALTFSLLLISHATQAADNPLGAQTFKLENGLEVLVHEDHTVPIVAVDVWYKVGSKEEEPQRTGFAHLFEHLMFQGSKHVGDDQHFRYISEAGGWLNGTTNKDRTNYLEIVPSNFLDRALWLEADRMGYLLDAISQEKLDNQRDVVKNERRQSYENRPYGMVPKLIAEGIFPPGHPYRWLTIGEHADLERASLADVKSFFRRYYHPNNAVLAIAGDVTLATAKTLVQKHFGHLLAGPKVVHGQAPALPSLSAEKIISQVDQVSLERIYLVWPSPAVFKPGDAALDGLSYVLGTKAGRLYKRLVFESRLAQSVEVHQASGLWASTFEIIVTLKPDKHAADVLPIIDEELARIQKEAPSESELRRAKNTLESDLVMGLMSVGGFNGRADTLARYAYFAGDPLYFPQDLQRYRSLGAVDLQAAARRLGKSRLQVVVVPKQKGAK